MEQYGVLSSAKELTQESLYPIADHRPPHFSADGNAHSIDFSIVGFADDDEMAGCDFSPSTGKAKELGAFGQAGSLGEFFPALRQLVLRSKSEPVLVVS